MNCEKHENWHAHCQRCCEEEIADLHTQVTEHDDFLFALSEKAPHLMGCAKTGSGGWICDERCLVARVEVQKNNIEVLLAENRSLEEQLKEALLNVAQHLRTPMFNGNPD